MDQNIANNVIMNARHAIIIPTIVHLADILNKFQMQMDGVNVNSGNTLIMKFNNALIVVYNVLVA